MVSKLSSALTGARLPGALFAALVMAHCVANVFWVHEDRTMRSFDMAPHLEAQLQVYSVLRHEGLSGLGRVFGSGVSSIWPSTGYLPGAVMALVFGHDIPTLRLFNLPYLVITLACVYLMGVRLGSRWLGLVAAALTSFYPLVYGESRQYSADFWGMAVTSLVVLALLHTERLSRGRASALAGLCAGLGMLIRPHSLMFWGVPALVVTVLALRRPAGGWRRIANNLALLAGVLALGSAPWWSQLGGLARELGAHAGGLDYDFGHGASILFYARALPYCLGWWLLVAALVAINTLRRGSSKPGDRASTVCDGGHRGEVLVVWAWLLGGLTALCLLGVAHLRYLLPVCPALGLLTARGLMSVGRGTTRRLAVLVVCGVGAVLWLQDSFFPLTPRDRTVIEVRERLGEVELASGPPSSVLLYDLHRSVAAIIARRHQSGRGVHVQLEQRNVRGWEHRIKGGPHTVSRLPGALVSDTSVKDTVHGGSGMFGVGSANVPLTCGPLWHDYQVIFCEEGDAVPRVAPPARKVFDGELGQTPNRSGIRVTIWYTRLDGRLDACSALR